MIDALIPVRGLAEAVGRPHERQARLLGRFHVALRVADVDRVADIAALTQQAQRLPLRQARVPEAVEVADQAAETALFHQQLDIALLAVADDEQAVRFVQLRERFLDAGVENMARIAAQARHLAVHAAVHDLHGLLLRDAGHHDLRDLRHGLAEQRTDALLRAVRRKAHALQTVVPALGYEGHGIPERAVDIKNQAFHC